MAVYHDIEASRRIEIVRLFEILSPLGVYEGRVHDYDATSLNYARATAGGLSTFVIKIKFLEGKPPYNLAIQAFPVHVPALPSGAPIDLVPKGSTTREAHISSEEYVHEWDISNPSHMIVEPGEYRIHIVCTCKDSERDALGRYNDLHFEDSFNVHMNSSAVLKAEILHPKNTFSSAQSEIKTKLKELIGTVVSGVPPFTYIWSINGHDVTSGSHTSNNLPPYNLKDPDYSHLVVGTNRIVLKVAQADGTSDTVPVDITITPDSVGMVFIKPKPDDANPPLIDLREINRLQIKIRITGGREPYTTALHVDSEALGAVAGVSAARHEFDVILGPSEQLEIRKLLIPLGEHHFIGIAHDADGMRLTADVKVISVCSDKELKLLKNKLAEEEEKFLRQVNSLKTDIAKMINLFYDEIEDLKEMINLMITLENDIGSGKGHHHVADALKLASSKRRMNLRELITHLRDYVQTIERIDQVIISLNQVIFDFCSRKSALISKYFTSDVYSGDYKRIPWISQFFAKVEEIKNLLDTIARIDKVRSRTVFSRVASLESNIDHTFKHLSFDYIREIEKSSASGVDPAREISGHLGQLKDHAAKYLGDLIQIYDALKEIKRQIDDETLWISKYFAYKNELSAILKH